MKTKLLLIIALIFSAINVNAQNPAVVSITGEAQGGWGNGFDRDMTSTDGENWTYSGLIVTTANSPTGVEGGLKFRANNDWAINWGSAAWPMGTGTQGGTNIQCIAGTYDVTFNSTTGEYNFSGGAPIPVAKIFGTAVTPATGITMTTLDAVVYKTTATFLDGTAQFDLDGTVVGDITFPDGTAGDALSFIPVVAGEYVVTFDTGTGAYSFVLVPQFELISLTGNAIAGSDWGLDTDLTPVDADNFRINDIALIVNQCKFRKDHAWVTTWGSNAVDGFPIGISNGENISVTTAGTYDAKLNIITGAYSFAFPQISLTGDAVGGWGDGFDFDLLTTDGVNYTLDNVVMTSAGCKFRRDRKWDTSWGGSGPTTFPTSPAGNSDIIAIAGTYNITFNNLTKEYNFTDALSTSSFASRNFKVFPNPTTNNWNFTAANEAIISVQVIDVLGKVVLSKNTASNQVNVDASSLTNGVYFARIATANATETVKLVKN